MARLDQPPAVLHVYAQPDEAKYLALQIDYAQAHPWFQVHKLSARSHFPMFEVPAKMADVIRAFAA